jgi:MYXO-CTERM domain-containing protein
MQGRVWPDDDVYVTDFAPAFLEAPWGALDAFDWPSETQYGHVLFVQYLDQHVGGADLVRESWAAAGPDDDALDVIADLVGDPGLGATFGDYLAHVAALDLVDGPALAAQDAADVAAGAPSLWTMTADALPAAGTQDDPYATPRSYGAGFAHLSFEAPDGGVRLRFFGAAGWDGGDAGWKLGVAARGSEGITYRAVDAPGGRATVDVEDDGVTELWLGAGPTADGGDTGLAWSWDARALDAAAADTGDAAGDAPTDAPPADDAPGCGCAHASTPFAGAGILAGLALARRRTSPRRRTC